VPSPSLDALSLDQPLKAGHDPVPVLGGRGERLREIDAAGKEQRRALPGFRRPAILLLPVVFDFFGQGVHWNSLRHSPASIFVQAGKAGRKFDPHNQ
jgi:hypothetical protein